MPYEFLDDVVLADIAFRAWGDDLQETFVSAAEALMNAMVEELDAIQPRQERTLDVQHEALDLLLFNFLQEFIYYKDAEQLLLRVRQLRIAAMPRPSTLHATAVGEPIDPARHRMRVDVKAVTLHRFSLAEVNGGWEAFVILDI